MEIITLLQSVANPALDALALALTHLGSENAYIVMLLVIYLAVDPATGRLLGLAVLIGYYLNQVIKDVVDTPRPYLVDPTLLRGDAAAATAPGPAFPSGHAQLAATFWWMAAALARRRWLWAVAVAAIVLVSLTRVYLGVHWLVDVIGGVLLGLGVAGLALAAARSRASLSSSLRVVLWVLLPLAVHLAWPTEDSGMIAGALTGFATGGMVVHHRPPADPRRRVALTVLGLALVFGWLFGTSFALDEAVKDHALVEPVRYFVLAWMGVVVAPWLGRHLGLAGEVAPA